MDILYMMELTQTERQRLESASLIPILWEVYVEMKFLPTLNLFEGMVRYFQILQPLQNLTDEFTPAVAEVLAMASFQQSWHGRYYLHKYGTPSMDTIYVGAIRLGEWYLRSIEGENTERVKVEIGEFLSAQERTFITLLYPILFPLMWKQA